MFKISAQGKTQHGQRVRVQVRVCQNLGKNYCFSFIKGPIEFFNELMSQTRQTMKNLASA